MRIEAILSLFYFAKEEEKNHDSGESNFAFYLIRSYFSLYITLLFVT